MQSFLSAKCLALARFNSFPPFTVYTKEILKDSLQFQEAAGVADLTLNSKTRYIHFLKERNYILKRREKP